MIGELQLVELLRYVQGENPLRRLPREQRKGDGDQPAHDQRIAVPGKAQYRVSGPVRHEGLQPYLAGAALHLVRSCAEGILERRQFLAELDDLLVPILPVVEDGEILLYLFDRRRRHQRVPFPACPTVPVTWIYALAPAAATSISREAPQPLLAPVGPRQDGIRSSMRRVFREASALLAATRVALPVIIGSALA